MVSATDVDTGDMISYTITLGNTGDAFAIGVTTGDITVAAGLDYETTASYTLTVEASDGRGGTATATVTVTVTDVAEDLAPAPENLSISLAEGVFSLMWDAVTGAAQYEVQHTTDAADAESVTWTALAAVTGTTRTYTPEEAPACGVTYRFRVRAFGDGETYAEIWGAESAVSSLAPNCAPAFTDAPYTFTVAEDASTGDLVGMVTATDVDTGDMISYAITLGDTGDAFAIGVSTGDITVAAGLDYENTEEYTLTVEASDGRGGSATAMVTITVTDVAEDLAPAPENLSVSLAGGVFSLSWDAVDGAAQYEAQHTTDAADAETVTWAALAAVTGTSQTYTPSTPACGVTYRFRVRAFGDGETYAEIWGAESAVSSLAPNCAPSFTNAPYAFEVAEDASTGDLVGMVSATDVDTGDMISYTITLGNTGDAFAIGVTTGDITVASGLDYETTASYTLTVEASDGRGGSATASVTITVTDVAEDPPPAPAQPSVSLFAGAFSLSWDAVDGAAQYEMQYTTDSADAETVTWTALVAVTSTTQTYTPSTPACGDTYRFRVRAYGDGETYAEVWGAESAATAFAANCPPTFANAPYTFEVAEDAAMDAVVGTVTAMDPNVGDTVAYGFIGGSGRSLFTLHQNTGVITVAVAGVLDYETTTSYRLRVVAIDPHGQAATTTVEITVTDVVGEGELELWSGEMTAGSFNMARASAVGYTSGLTWGGIVSEGTLGTLDDTTFEYGGQTYTVQLAAYFEAVGNRDPYFFIGLKERLLPTDVELVLYVGSHRLSGWSTTGLGEITTHYYYVANPGFTLESGQVVTLSLRKANPSEDSGLESLSVSAGTLGPAFDSARQRPTQPLWTTRSRRSR